MFSWCIQFMWGQWVGVGLNKLYVVANVNKVTYFLSFFILGISNSYCMWELLNLCWNVWKIVALIIENHVRIEGILLMSRDIGQNAVSSKMIQKEQSWRYDFQS